jgi:hypothetical protein
MCSTVAGTSWGRASARPIRHQLDLEPVDERLGERVVVGVADRADRLQHGVIVERLAVVDRAVPPGLNRSSQQCE